MASSTRNVSSAMGLAVADTVEDLGAQAVIACTQSELLLVQSLNTVHLHQLLLQLLAKKTATSLALYWGVQPVVVEETANTDELLATAAKVAEDFRWIRIRRNRSCYCWITCR